MQSGGLMTSGHSGETSTEGELFTNFVWYFPNTALPTYAEAQWPPSTLRSAPVMNELPCDSRNTAGALKSSGAPSLPRSAPAIQIFSSSGFVARSASVMAVLMYPGDRVFTLMPYWPHSCATDRHSCCTAALLLLYAEHVNPWKERRQLLSKYT